INKKAQFKLTVARVLMESIYPYLLIASSPVIGLLICYHRSILPSLMALP
ncbi:hypothetical protein COCCADRAFT_82046, partial [Bipolaris zeicola 26-R-13]